jgi:hypothetical protein
VSCRTASIGFQGNTIKRGTHGKFSRQKTEIEKAGEALFNFAVDREDVKALVANLPEETDIQGVTVEYELQILKIISVGWSISYY